MPEFIDNALPDDWGSIELTYLRTKVWSAKLYVEMPNPSDISTTGYLQFYVQGDTPDETIARLEKSVIETLAQGGELEERRSSGPGRRAYDSLSWPGGGSYLDFIKAADRRA